MANVPFTCPQCGSDLKLRVSSEAKSLDDLIGAPCAKCGHPLTEDEVKKQVLKIAEDAFKKRFGN
jgi:transcription initiation factor IIE alpha subunit